MHILLINHYAGTPAMGMEFRPYFMASEWLKQGQRVTIVAASHAHVRHHQPEMNSNYKYENIDGINYIWLDTPEYNQNNKRRILNILVFLKRLFLFKKWLKQRVDVVISSSTYTLDIFPARRIARKNNARLIYEVHDLWPLSPIELGGYSKYHPFIMLVQMAENYAYKYSDHVVSMLPNAFGHMKDHGLSESKYSHIPNGTQIAEHKNPDLSEASHKILNIFNNYKNEGYFIVGYTGSIGLANALDTLLRAAEILCDERIKFIIIGNGPEKDNLKIMTQQLNLVNIEFYNPVPKNQLYHLLKELDLLYIGLQSQSLFRFGISPNKLIDYMMAGRPVLQAIDAGNDLVSDARCGLTVKPENPQAIASAILELKKMEKSELDMLGNNGYKYVKANHDYKILAEQFLKVITNEQ